MTQYTDTRGSSRRLRRIRAAAIGVVGTLLALALEGGSYVVLRALSANPRTQPLVYVPPVIDTAQYERYMRKRDPNLGWPSPEDMGGPRHDRTGSRPNPSYPDPGNECLSLYGDSFTYASDVEDAQAWSNVLSRALACRVSNFGVGGYGTDQAFMRFRLNTADRASVTLLGIYPDDAVRNLTRDAFLAFGTFPASFKPRFTLSGGQLEPQPMPVVPVDRLADYARDPRRYLGEDGLLPGSANGPVRAEFPHILGLLRVATGPRVRNWIAGRPSWSNMYEPGDSGHGLEIMLGIVEHFAAECLARGKRCGVILFPTPKSYEYLVRTKRSVFAHLTQGLDRLGIPYLDLALALRRELAGQPFCDLVATPGSCAGHFNARGNFVVARLVEAFLRDSGISPAAPAAAGK